MSRFIESLERRQLLCGIAPAGVGTIGPVPPLLVAGPLAAAEGTWQTGPAMPHNLAEVAAGMIGVNLYVVGELDSATFVFNIALNNWSTGAARPFPGNHHAAEVYNGKLYLFGGLTAGSDGKVQIYDPASNTWSAGADIPFAAGSSSSALIGGKIYVAGGIIGEHTTSRVAAYDPALNTWTEMAPMPQGRNHTAAATDRQKMYVFGGRGPGSGDRNVTTNGFDSVQVYDPATNTWQSSLDAGSTLAPLPQARGGMGKAVYVGGEFYVIGGETLTGAGATDDGVYHRVDVYNPATNTWRTDTEMPTARHGIFPVESGGMVYVAGGGVHFGGSGSAVLEMFRPGQAPDPPPPEPPVVPPPAPAATVVGRWVFYNNSAYDGNDPAATAADDGAIATDKAAALPGAPTSFANYTSYSKGINGVMVDVANLPAFTAPTAENFIFEVGGNATPSPGMWSTAPPPSSVTMRPGAGVNGSTRITLTWPDGQIQKTWLRVRVVATSATGLAAEDRFYFGNWPGETGTLSGDTRVNKRDAKAVNRARVRRGKPVAAPDIQSRVDFNRDGVVDVSDRRVVARNRTKRKSFLVLIAPE